MKHTILIVLFFSLLTVHQICLGFDIIGTQPSIAVDFNNIIRVVYGNENKIYCISSTNNGVSFTIPYEIAEVPNLMIGMGRGPQVASSVGNTLITAIDKDGNIHCYNLNHKTGLWKPISNVNDLAGSAKEGLMSLCCDANDHFYAVWLDLRGSQKNKIYFSSWILNEGWSPNIQIYDSPERTVCECCKPNISYKKGTIGIMFRNFLKGNRDMFLTTSVDNGKSFTKPEKLGKGNWKLNGCPMDGGGITIDNKGIIHTVWRREGDLFYCKKGEEEVFISKGRNGSINSNHKLISAWQSDGNIKIKIGDNEELLGEGNYPKLITLNTGKTMVVWENNGTIKTVLK